MANKKINELVSRVPSLTDLMLVGDPSSGYSYKATVSALATIIETDISDAFVTLATTQTISGAKTFSNVLTLTSVANSPTDTDKFLVLNASNVVNYRTGSEVLSDIGGVPTSRTLTINGTSYDLSANRSWNVGTVVFVGLTVPTGLTVSGSPITETGIFSINFQSGYSIPTTASQANWDTAYTNRITSLTTTGSSGAATLVSNTLNIPNYTLAGLGGVSGSGTTNYIPKFTSSSAIGNSVIYEASGDIGVGTTSPDVFSRFYSGTILGVSGSGQSSIGINAASGSASYFDMGVNGTRSFSIYADASIADISTIGALPLTFGINSSEQMRLTSTGLGIGTSSPTHKLNVANDNYNFRIANSTNAQGYNIGRNTTDGLLYFYGDENNYVGYVFSGVNGERMRLNSSGNLGLGVTPSAWDGSFKALEVNNFALFSQDATGAGWLSKNARNVGGTWYYIGTGYANYVEQGAGAFKWNIAPSGIAGNAISFTQAMTLDASGRLLIAATSDFGSGTRMLVNGTITAMSSTWNNSNAGGAIQMFSNSADYGTIWALKNGNQAWGNIAIAPSGGNVGIGTTSPTQKLEVNGTIIGGNFYIPAGSAGTYGLADLSSAIQTYSGSVSPANTTIFYNGGSERMRITSGGNVGIGTTSPGDKLQVNGDVSISATSRYYLDAGTGGLSIRGSAANGDMQFYSNYSERMRIKSSGVINLSNVPSDSTGLATGDIYRDGDGYLKIVL